MADAYGSDVVAASPLTTVEPSSALLGIVTAIEARPR
jgi:hypothetical protein